MNGVAFKLSAPISLLYIIMQQSSTPSSTSAQHAKQELLSAGWPCCEFINSGVSVQVLQRPSDSLHSIFTGDLELEADAGVDSSGLDVWSGACNLLCSHIACHPELIRARNVLELGSGMGVCGLFAAQTRFGARTVALTDAGNFVMKVPLDVDEWCAKCDAVTGLGCEFGHE